MRVVAGSAVAGQANGRSWLVVAALALGGGLLLCPWINAVPLLDADEPRFAECSRQMLVTGDWIYPQFNSQPRHAKPPLFNWVQATFFAVGGVSELTARLPSVLATVGTGLLLFGFASAWRGPRLGLLALATWFCLPQTHLWAKMSVVDPLLTLLTAGALMAAFLGVEGTGGVRWNGYLLCGLAMGLATMTKGPVGIVVPGVAYVLYLLLSGSIRKGLGHGGPWVALLIALAVAAPWFAGQVMRYGHGYVDAFFGFDNVERYTEARDALGPVGWLWPVPVVLLFAFPLAILLPRSLGEALRGPRSARGGDRDARWRLFAAVWLLSDAVLFAPSATRLPQYFMALYPAATLLAADLLARMLTGTEPRGRRWPIALGSLLGGLLLGGGFAYAGLRIAELAPKAHLDDLSVMAPVVWALAGTFAVGGVVCAAAWGGGGARTAVMGVLAVGLLAGLVIANVVWPAVGLTRDQGLKELSLIARETMAPSAPLITYGLHTSTVVFYSDHLHLEVEKHDPQAAMGLLRRHPASWLITHRDDRDELPLTSLETVAQSRQYVLLRISDAR